MHAATPAALIEGVDFDGVRGGEVLEELGMLVGVVGETVEVD